MPTDTLDHLVGLVGSAPGALLTAVALAGYWYERRKVDQLQRRLYRLAAAGLAVAPKVRDE